MSAKHAWWYAALLYGTWLCKTVGNAGLQNRHFYLVIIKLLLICFSTFLPHVSFSVDAPTTFWQRSLTWKPRAKLRTGWAGWGYLQTTLTPKAPVRTSLKTHPSSPGRRSPMESQSVKPKCNECNHKPSSTRSILIRHKWGQVHSFWWQLFVSFATKLQGSFSAKQLAMHFQDAHIIIFKSSWSRATNQNKQTLNAYYSSERFYFCFMKPDFPNVIFSAERRIYAICGADCTMYRLYIFHTIISDYHVETQNHLTFFTPASVPENSRESLSSSCSAVINQLW